MLTLVLLGKIGLQRVSIQEVGSDSFYFLKKRLFSMLSVLPIFLGIFIAASRVHDDMHHPADVVGGSVIGIGCAYLHTVCGIHQFTHKELVIPFKPLQWRNSN